MDPSGNSSQAHAQPPSAACSCEKSNNATSSTAPAKPTSSAAASANATSAAAATTNVTAAEVLQQRDSTSSAATPNNVKSAAEAAHQRDSAAASAAADADADADSGFQLAPASPCGASPPETARANVSHNTPNGRNAVETSSQSLQADVTGSQRDHSSISPEAGAGRFRHDPAASSSGCLAGYSWQLPPGTQQEDGTMVWVGPDDVPTLMHLHLAFNKYAYRAVVGT